MISSILVPVLGLFLMFNLSLLTLTTIPYEIVHKNTYKYRKILKGRGVNMNDKYSIQTKLDKYGL